MRLVKRKFGELQSGEQVAELVFFRAQVSARVLAGARPAGDSLYDADAGTLELLDFIGIVREQAHRTQAERFERFGCKFVIACVIGKTKFAIGFHGVETGVLQFVGFQFINQADAASFLRQVEHDPRRLGRNFPEREFELSAAVAALRGEDVSGEALGMDAHERRASIARLPVLNRDRFLTFFPAFDSENAKAPEARGQVRFRHDARLPGLFFALHLNQQL